MIDSRIQSVDSFELYKEEEEVGAEDQQEYFLHLTEHSI